MTHNNKAFRSQNGFESDAPIVNNNVDHNVLPGGTTAQRPTVAPERAHRLNTDTNKIEFFVNGAWRTTVSPEELQNVEELSFVYAITLS